MNLICFLFCEKLSKYHSLSIYLFNFFVKFDHNFSFIYDKYIKEVKQHINIDNNENSHFIPNRKVYSFYHFIIFFTGLIEPNCRCYFEKT